MSQQTTTANPASSNNLFVFTAYFAAFLGVCGHASSEFFVRLSGLGGAEVSVWRFMVGGLALIIVAMARSDARDLITPLRQDFIPIVSLSIFGMTLGQFMFHVALDYASVVQVATLVTTMPIFVVFVARIVDKTPISTAKVISGIGAFLGCLFLLTDGVMDQLAGGSSVIGILLSIGCALIGGLYIVLVKPYTAKYGAVRMTTYTFVMGFFVLWPVVGLLWDTWINPLTLLERPMVEVGSILTLGIWNTCIGFILWLWGLAHVPDVARGNYLFFLKPVIAAVLSFFILGTDISPTELLAIIAITGFVAAEVVYSEVKSRKAVNAA